MAYALEQMAIRLKGHVRRTKIPKYHLLCELMKDDVYSGAINQYMIQYDAVASLIKIIEFLCTNNTSFDLLLKLIASYCLKQTTILCPFEQIGRVVRTVFFDNASHFQLLGGLRIDFHDSWVIIIPDGQKPFIHLYAEGQTEKKADCFYKIMLP